MFYFLVHNSMVTSAIFAPNSNQIMNYLYSSSQSPPSAARPTLSATTLVNSDNNRSRVSGLPTASNSLEGSLTINNTGPIYVMVTADSKGQLKLLVNRYHR